MKIHWLFLLFVLCLAGCAPAPIAPTLTPTEMLTTERTGPYLGETLPDAEPIRFGKDFFSGSFHSAPVFSADGNTVWWAGAYQSATIYTSHVLDGVWTKPATIRFSEAIKSYRDPFISPDGSKFYFISEAALPGAGTGGKENIWMMEKKGDAWSEPEPLPESINALSLHWTLSVAANYNLYFSAKNGEKTDIYLSVFENGSYTDPFPLDVSVNTDAGEFTPNIAPDESYLLFTRILDSNSEPLLYIAYAIESGWSEPAMVENVPYCISPIITPDRAYVIYLSSPSSFGWRDISFIEDLR